MIGYAYFLIFIILDLGKLKKMSIKWSPSTDKAHKIIE